MKSKKKFWGKNKKKNRIKKRADLKKKRANLEKKEHSIKRGGAEKGSFAQEGRVEKDQPMSARLT